MTDFYTKLHPATDKLHEVESLYPNIWRFADEIRALPSGKRLEGCLFSDAEGSVLSKKIEGIDNNNPSFHPSLLSALVSWRPTQGIYRFHPDLYEALLDTELKGDIPSQLLLRLPGWAVYIETPRSENMPFQISGFWAYLSRQGKQNELTLVGLWDKDGDYLNTGTDPARDIAYFSLPFDNKPIPELLENMFQQRADANNTRTVLTDDTKPIFVQVVSGMLSLLLYLCSEKPDIENWAPLQPKEKYFGKTKRLLKAKEIHAWDVGLRIGAALKISNEHSRKEASDGSNASTVRPHVRRAHWHAYWVGKRDQQRIILKWLAPIPVNVEDIDNLPSVIHDVE